MSLISILNGHVLRCVATDGADEDSTGMVIECDDDTTTQVISSCFHKCSSLISFPFSLQFSAL